eukprot:8135267-Pyramimonas_sp.AAC.1
MRARSFGIGSLFSNCWADSIGAGRANAVLSTTLGSRILTVGVPFVAGGDFNVNSVSRAPPSI